MFKKLKDILWIYYKIDLKNNQLASHITPSSYLSKLIRCIKHILKLIQYCFYSNSKHNEIKGKKWLHVISMNTYRSIHPLIDETYSCVNIGFELNLPFSEIVFLKYPLKLFGVFFFIPNLIFLTACKGFRSIKILDVIFYASGAYISSWFLLKKFAPKCIVFSNDHNFDSRALLLAAKSLSIPCIYIQHASISKNFPPLLFDLALLEGQDSKDKYEQIEPIINCKVDLIGNPKFDNYINSRRNISTIKTIGIFTNILDLELSVIEIIELLSSNNYRILYRPHPRQKYSIKHKLISEYSNSNDENIFDALKKIDLLISGNSTSHLDAAIMNIPSISYLFHEHEFKDTYGYVEKGLSKLCRNKKELLEQIMKFEKNGLEQFYLKAKHYNANIENNGVRSTKLAKLHIDKFLKENN